MGKITLIQMNQDGATPPTIPGVDTTYSYFYTLRLKDNLGNHALYVSRELTSGSPMPAANWNGWNGSSYVSGTLPSQDIMPSAWIAGTYSITAMYDANVFHKFFISASNAGAASIPLFGWADKPEGPITPLALVATPSGSYGSGFPTFILPTYKACQVGCFTIMMGTNGCSGDTQSPSFNTIGFQRANFRLPNVSSGARIKQEASNWEESAIALLGGFLNHYLQLRVDLGFERLVEKLDDAARPRLKEGEHPMRIRNTIVFIFCLALLCWGQQVNTQSAGGGTSFPTVVTPEQFGAKRDGTTNDSVAIQNAINSLTNGGTVKFAAGTYAVNTLPLTITVSSVNLVGEGSAGGTTLMSTDVTHDILQITGGGTGNCAASGITFNKVMHMAFGRTGATATGNGITISHGCGITLQDLFVDDSVKVINNVLSGHTNVIDVYVNWNFGGATQSYGYYSDTQVDSTQIRGMHVTCNGTSKYGYYTTHAVDMFVDYFETVFCDYGVFLNGTNNDVHFTNSILDGCNLACFHLDHSTVGGGSQPGTVLVGGFFRPTSANSIAFDINTVNGLVITNTVTQATNNSGTIGLKLSNVAAAVFSNNVIQGVRTGISSVSGSGGNVLSGNLFFTDGSSAATTWLSFAGSSGSWISSNLLSGTATNGISFDATSNNNIVRDNSIGVSGTAISNSGTNNQFTGNNNGGVTLDGLPSVNATSCTGATLGTGSTNVAGTITGLPAGACSVVLTFGTYKPTTGWACTVSDQTTANLFRQSAGTRTTATFAGTSAAADVLRYNCIPY